MDKFGIFNLLNSFFPLTNQKNQESTAENSASSFASNLVSSLGKTLFSQTSAPQKNQPNTEKENPNQLPPLPLQQNMLLTINSHDEFVKRVKEKHKLPK